MPNIFKKLLVIAGDSIQTDQKFVAGPYTQKAKCSIVAQWHMNLFMSLLQTGISDIGEIGENMFELTALSYKFVLFLDPSTAASLRTGLDYICYQENKGLKIYKCTW